MPLVQVPMIKGVFTPEMKKKVIEKVTDAMVAVEGENLRPDPKRTFGLSLRGRHKLGRLFLNPMAASGL